MKKLRILNLMHEDLVPPEDVSKIDIISAPWKTEYDIITSLREMQHEVLPLGLRSDLRVIREAIEKWEPHIIFNMLEEFDGEVVFDQHVVGYLELLRMPYTGCNPRGLMLARDKALSKKVLAYHRVPVPDFAVFPLGRKVKKPKKLTYPLIVKSLIEEASLGISQASIVHDDRGLEDRVRFIHNRIKTDAIAEEFIEGRELYVSIVGNSRLTVFPVWELHFKKMPETSARIATEKVKWDHAYQEKMGIDSGEAKGLSAEETTKIHQMCKRVFRILGLNGYARVDLRMNSKGQIFVLEANPNPQIAYGEDFAESAERGGVLYKDLLQRILNLGLRWHISR